jgi:alcohol dehydrogenase class IV
VLCALSTHGESAGRVAEAAVESGRLPVADDADPLPMVGVPTTLAGADLSDLAGVALTLDRDGSGDDPPSGGVRDPRLMPAALCYDLDLYRTTPTSILAASAMNGFDKGVEMCYSPLATPITDGTAARGLGLLRSGLGTIREEPMDCDRLTDVLRGIVAVQYGLAGREGYRASLIHAFGHGFSHGYDVHQGTIHGIVAPHVLRYVFDRVDGRRDLLASALDVADTDTDPAEAVIDAVAGVRDDLGLPQRLNDVDGVERSDLSSIADAIRDDDLLGVAPEGIDPSVDDIESVLDRAW